MFDDFDEERRGALTGGQFEAMWTENDPQCTRAALHEPVSNVVAVPLLRSGCADRACSTADGLSKLLTGDANPAAAKPRRGSLSLLTDAASRMAPSSRRKADRTPTSSERTSRSSERTSKTTSSDRTSSSVGAVLAPKSDVYTVRKTQYV
jgi:hypothetical protein